MLELLQADSRARKDLAMSFHNHKDHARVHYTPSGEVACPFTTQDMVRIKFEQGFNKSPETAKFRVQQILRGRSDDDHDQGKEYLVIQGTVFVDDFAHNRKEYAFSIGIVVTPVWMKKAGGYSQEDGSPINITDEIARFQDEKTISFSPELVKSLSPHFYHVSLIVKAPNGRKYTCKSVDQFCGEYDQVCAQLQPKDV